MAQGMRQGTVLFSPKMKGKDEEKLGAACSVINIYCALGVDLVLSLRPAIIQYVQSYQWLLTWIAGKLILPMGLLSSKPKIPLT